MTLPSSRATTGVDDLHVGRVSEVDPDAHRSAPRARGRPARETTARSSSARTAPDSSTTAAPGTRRTRPDRAFAPRAAVPSLARAGVARPPPTRRSRSRSSARRSDSTWSTSFFGRPSGRKSSRSQNVQAAHQRLMHVRERRFAHGQRLQDVRGVEVVDPGADGALRIRPRAVRALRLQRRLERLRRPLAGTGARKHRAREQVRVVDQVVLVREVAEVARGRVHVRLEVADRTFGGASPALVAQELAAVQEGLRRERGRDRVRRIPGIGEEPGLDVEVVAPGQTGLVAGVMLLEPSQPALRLAPGHLFSRGRPEAGVPRRDQAEGFRVPVGLDPEQRPQVDRRLLDHLGDHSPPEGRTEGENGSSRAVERVVRVVALPVPAFTPRAQARDRLLDQIPRLGTCLCPRCCHDDRNAQCPWK